MESSYHHGALREALVTDGRRLLADQGVEAVTLRELARRAGVSHAAPRRHFADRDALLAAIAARGFDELTDALRQASTADGLEARLTSYAHAHVRFALDNGPLMTLMFGEKGALRTGPAAESAGRFFALGAELLGERTDEHGAPTGPMPYLVAATFEGIGALVVAGRLPDERVDEVVDAAIAMLLPRLEEQLRRDR